MSALIKITVDVSEKELESITKYLALRHEEEQASYHVDDGIILGTALAFGACLLRLKFLIASYANDALHLDEYSARATVDARRARIKVAELQAKLAALGTKIHANRDALVAWIVIIAGSAALWLTR